MSGPSFSTELGVSIPGQGSLIDRGVHSRAPRIFPLAPLPVASDSRTSSRLETQPTMEQVTDALKKATIGGADKKAKKDKKAPGADADAGPLEMQPPPAFIQERIELFDRLYKEQQEELARKPRHEILITMPDGTIKPGKAYETTPAEIAKGISNSLYKRTVVARIDGDQLWDLERPLEKSCKLELLDFNDDQGKFVFCMAALRNLVRSEHTDRFLSSQGTPAPISSVRLARGGLAARYAPATLHWHISCTDVVS